MIKIFIFIFLFVQISFAQTLSPPRLINLFPGDTDFENCVNHFNSFYPLPQYTNVGVTFGSSQLYTDGGTNGAELINKIGFQVNFASYPEGGLFSVGSCLHSESQSRTNTNLKIMNYNTTNKVQIACGSIIDYDKKTISESIPIVGSDFRLNYTTQFSSGFQRQITEEFFDTKYINTNFRFMTTINGIVLPSLNLTTLSGGIVRQFSIPSQILPISTSPYLDKYAVSSTFNKIIKYMSTGGGSCGINCFTVPVETEVEFPIYTNQSTVSVFNPSVFGLGGWTVSKMNFFDRENKMMYTGTGQIISQSTFRTVTLPEYGIVDMVIEKNAGQQIYIFDQLGRHLETRHAVFNYPIYKFQYNNNKISKITDRYGSDINFEYSANGLASKILSSKGISTDLIYTNDQLSHVTAAGKSYLVEYNSNNLISKFTDAKNVETSFSYNDKNEIVSESKNTNEFQSFYDIILGSFKQQIHEKGFGIDNKVQISYGSNYSTVSEVDEQGRISFTNKNYAVGNNSIEESAPGFNKYSNIAGSAMWGTSYAPAVQAQTLITESSQNIDQNVIDYETRNYQDATNPLSISGTTTQKRIGTKTEFIYTYPTANGGKSILQQDPGGNYSYFDFNNIGLLIKLRPANQYPTDITYNADGKIIKKQKGTEWTSYGYDQYGYLNQESNSNNQTTAYINDIEGKILEKTLPNGDKVKFEYTDGNEIKKITAPNNQVHYFQMSLGDFITNADEALP